MMLSPAHRKYPKAGIALIAGNPASWKTTCVELRSNTPESFAILENWLVSLYTVNRKRSKKERLAFGKNVPVSGEN